MPCEIKALDHAVDLTRSELRTLYVAEWEDAWGGKGSQVYLYANDRDVVAHRVSLRKTTTQVLSYSLIAPLYMSLTSVQEYVEAHMQLMAMEEDHVQTRD